MMRHLAIIGSGPAGYYTAEAALKRWGDAVRIDVFDALPVPFGLIRSGVAPDHQSIKAVSRRYEKVAASDQARFVGNVRVGSDVSIGEMLGLYDTIVLATGAPEDRKPELPGLGLRNVFGSAEFVGWYNGHPAFAALEPDLSVQSAVIIGMGNVALDVARILSKTEDEFAGSDIVGHSLNALRRSKIERITIVGRRGPHQIAMTPKELGELGDLDRAAPTVDPSDLPPLAEDDALEPGIRKSVGLLRGYAASAKTKPIDLAFDFYANPIALHGEGCVAQVEVERTKLVDGRAEGTGETYRIPAGLVVSCIGYRTAPIADVAYDDRLGRFENEDGRIADRLFCVGWARRGPTGTIGTNRPDGYALIDRIASDRPEALPMPGRAGFDALASERGLDIVTFADWRRIEKAEVAAARAGSPREKFVDLASMIRARGGPIEPSS